MNIAYFVNQYPQPSQSFIRREIHALESLSMKVHRFTARRWDGELVDEADRREQQRARVVLDVGSLGLLLATTRTIVTRPAAFFRALRLAIDVGRRSQRGLLLHLIYLAEACVLRKWLAECGAEHVHAHFGTNSTAVVMLCRLLGGPPYSFTAHGPEEFDRPQSLGLAEKIRHAAFVVTISSFGRSQLCRWADYADWDKIQIVRCGVDESFLAAPATPPPEAPRLCCVARLAEQKGQLLLVQAAKRLADERREFQIRLVGDGPMRPEIEQEIARLGLGGRIVITGWKSNDEVRQEIMESRALVLPSFAEGLPVVIMEALALRRPVVSTYVAGIPELVEPGACGWLVPAGAVEPLADAMRQALDAPAEQLARMGEEGARRVKERHCAATEAEKLAHLIAKGDVTAPNVLSYSVPLPPNEGRAKAARPLQG